MKHPSSSSQMEQVLVVKSDSIRGWSKTRVRYYDKRDDRSQSRSWKEIECFYCHEKGHIGRNYEELTKHLEEKKKQKTQEREYANVVGHKFDGKGDVYFVTTDENISNPSLLYFGFQMFVSYVST